MARTLVQKTGAVTRAAPIPATTARKASLERAQARKAARKASKARNRAARKANEQTEESRRQAQPATLTPTRKQNTGNPHKERFPNMQLVPVNLAKLHDRGVYEQSLQIATNIGRAVESETMSVATPEQITELAVLILTTVQGCSCGYVVPADSQMLQVQPALIKFDLPKLCKLVGGWCEPAPLNPGTPWNHRHRLVIREQEGVADLPVNPLASIIAGTLVRGTACFVPISQIDRALYEAPRWKSLKPIDLELPLEEPSALTG